MTRYLSVKNFDRFQHYKDRDPPWIKLHRSILSDYEFNGLPEAAQCQLLKLWLLAARHENRIPYDRSWLARTLGTRRLMLDAMIDAGFLVVVSGEEEVATRREDWASRHIPKPIRQKVLERSSGACVACGSTEKVEIDHIVPISKGGTGEEENLQALCRSCNRKKRQSAEPKPPQKLRSGGALARADAPSREGEREGEGEKETESSSSARGRDLLMDRLTESRRTGMAACLAMWASGHDLPPGTGVPNAAQIDTACREVLASVEPGHITTRVVRGFLVRAIRGHDTPPPTNGKARGAAAWDDVQ